MELSLFQKKFEVFQEFKNKMPGIEIGLNFLLDFSQNEKKIHNNIENKVIDKLGSVVHYDYVYNELNNYSFIDLNTKIKILYHNNILNNKLLLYNKLYWIFSDVYENFYSKYNYKYNKNNCDMHDVLFNFFQGLRLNRTMDPTKFFLNPVLMCYKDVQYFDPKVTPEQYYLFLFNFVLELSKERVLDYCVKDHSIAFNPEYKNDLLNLIYFSSDLMVLGTSSITEPFMTLFDLSQDDVEAELKGYYSLYEKSDDLAKLYINDMLVSLVISSSTTIISAHNKINNIYTEILHKCLRP